MTTDALSRRVLRYAYAQGTGRSGLPAAPAAAGAETAPALPATRDGAGATSPLPPGTTEVLESIPFPAGRAAAGVTHPLERALSTAFGLQRAELTNPYFEHRSLPSVRSLFPVQAFVTGSGRPRVLDVHRHALTELDVPAVPQPACSAGSTGRDLDARRVLLAGRYTRLPAFYGRLRGTLTELEMGISLRSLAVSLELFGLQGRFSPPTSGEALAELGVEPQGEWTWPFVIDLPGTPPAVDRRRTGRPATFSPLPADPELAEIVVANRAQAGPSPAAPADLTPAIASAPGGRELSWAQVLWERGSGRMPGRLTGMSGRPFQARKATLTGAAAWAAVPPPGELLRRVADLVRVTVVVQATDGHQDGVHRLAGDGLELVRSAWGLPTLLERHYGYGLAPGNGCDVRHASALWFFSVRQRHLVSECGPGAWTLAQYVAGWITQGLCLNAAAHGLYARPARAFDGLAVQRPLGLEPDETLLLSVISGAPRFLGLPLDLRW